jgi:hypothetical protein
MSKKQSMMLFGLFVAAGLSPFIPLPTLDRRVSADNAGANPVVASTATPAATAPSADPMDNLDPTTNKPRVPHPAPAAGEALSMTIKQLGNFNYDAEKGGTLPADVVALSGHTLKTTGYMIPLDEVTNITQFALVPSLTGCCFGQPPGIQHVILVRVPKNQALKSTNDPVLVSGTLIVKEKREDGYTTDLFELQATSVIPLPQSAITQ